MKKLIPMFLLVLTLGSCSEELAIQEVESTADLEYNMNSEITSYRGVFTTLNSEYRATVEISIPQSNDSGLSAQKMNYPIIILITQAMEVYTAKATEEWYAGNAVSELKFESPYLSLKFSVEEDGSEPTVTDVVFKGLEGSIIVFRHTERAPVTPITGTYNCVNCNGHPNLDTGLTQTFNMVFSVADGEGSITTQTILDTTMYSGVGYQDSCSANGNITDCIIESGDGSTTTTGYLANGNPVTWSGKHFFNNEPTGANDCSGISGTWQWTSNSYGTLTGRFESDLNCFQLLYLEDFETFTGSGFSPNPAPGQLDSDIIIATGFSDGSMNYGDTQTSGDFARGTANVTFGATTGGIYAFDFDNNPVIEAYALGIQPTDDDFTPGTIEFRIQNTTGNTLNALRFSYGVYANNNEERANSIGFSYSLDGTNFTTIPEFEFISIEETPPPIVPPPPPEIPILTNYNAVENVTVTAGAFIYLRFTGNVVSGSGFHDEFSIDNVMLEGI